MATQTAGGGTSEALPAPRRLYRHPGILIAGAISGGLTAVHPALGASLLSAGAFLWLVLSRVSWAVVIFLLVRPGMDWATRFGFLVGRVRFNLAGLLGVLVIGVAAAYLVDRLVRRRPVTAGGAPALALGLIVAWAAFGTLVGVQVLGPKMLAIGLRETVRLASLLALYWLLVNLLRHGMPPERVVRALYSGLVAPALVGAFEFLQFFLRGAYSGPGSALPPGRLTGTFVHGVGFGLFLAVFVTLSLTLWRSRHRRGLPRWVPALALASTAFLLVFTWARGAWLFLAVMLGVKLLLEPRRMLVPVLVLSVAGGALFGPRIAARFSDVRPDMSLRRIVAWDQHENSFEWRILNWFILVNIGSHRPLLGHGTGATPEVNPIRDRSHFFDEVRGYSAHNEFVAYFVEGGAAGVAVLCAYFYLLGRWLWRVRRKLRARGDPAGELAGVALEVLAGFLVISALTTQPLGGTALYYYVVCLFALVKAAEETGEVAAEPNRRPSPGSVEAVRSPGT